MTDKIEELIERLEANIFVQAVIAQLKPDDSPEYEAATNAEAVMSDALAAIRNLKSQDEPR